MTGPGTLPVGRRTKPFRKKIHEGADFFDVRRPGRSRAEIAPSSPDRPGSASRVHNKFPGIGQVSAATMLQEVNLFAAKGRGIKHAENKVHQATRRVA
jgi:hypothetical protein